MADAVYAGVSHFSLRIRAGKEFTFETFKEGIDYAHAWGKKVYATINGFPFNSQIDLKKNILQQWLLWTRWFYCSSSRSCKIM